MTKHWALQDAKARLSELVRAAGKEPQHITLRGEPAAVVISEDEYSRLLGKKERQASKPSLLEILRSAPPGFAELDIPPRKRERPRKIGL